MNLKRWVLICLLVGVFVLLVYAQQNNKPLTNADIIQMREEKVDEDIVLRAIATSKINFDISPAGLIQLKRGKVKKQIIEAIQNAQLSKNSEREAANVNSKERPQPSGIFPDAPPMTLNSPTPKPTPVATQDANFFTFELENCLLSGTSVECFFNIKNKSDDRLFKLDFERTEIIDDTGSQAVANWAKLADREGGGTYADHDIVANMSIKLRIRFMTTNPSAHRIERLKMHCYSNGNPFDLVFRNVPLKR
jgi:hypothetical protein